jgi:chemotaxis protein methyltransferase CheR
MQNMEITFEELNAFTLAVKKRHGIDFTGYEPKSLHRRVMRAISVFGFSGIHELWVNVLRDQTFIHRFMDVISVGLTSMFRDPILWKTMRDRIPAMCDQSDEIKIWHAGCSTGEEVYTMGVVLEETNTVSCTKALATDISMEALDTARKGFYHEVKMPEFERNYKEYNLTGHFEQYYTPSACGACFDNKLIGHADFRYHNLVSEECVGKFDVIFCRNVMIYFDNALKVKMIRQFYESLKPGGLFIIGFFDAIMPVMDTSLFCVDDLDAKIFRRCA